MSKTERRQKGNRDFHGRKVGVSWQKSRSFMAGNSEGLKRKEKGSPRPP
jgi:hypothetical protein